MKKCKKVGFYKYFREFCRAKRIIIRQEINKNRIQLWQTGIY